MLKDFHFPGNDLSCPLGHECSRCLWHVPAKGEDPYTGQPIDDFDCAIVLLAVMTGDNGRRIHQLHAGVTQQTVETVKRQDALLTMVAGGPRPSDVDTRSALPSDHPESLPSPQEQP